MLQFYSILSKKHIVLFLIICCCSSSIIGQSFKVTPTHPIKIVKNFIPPQLEIIGTPELIDDNGNRAIDANETCSIVMVVKNTGKGDAENLSAELVCSGNIQGIHYDSKYHLRNIKADTQDTIRLKFQTDTTTTDGSVLFNFSIKEPHGFGSKDCQLKASINAFQRPLVVVALEKHEKKQMCPARAFPFSIWIQNKKGIANDVEVELVMPRFVMPTSAHGARKDIIGTLRDGEFKKIDYEMMATRDYKDSIIEIIIKISERNGYAQDDTIKIPFTQDAPNYSETTPIPIVPKEPKIAYIIPPTDTDIPESAAKNDSTFVLIIANKDYKYEPVVSTAVNDGAVMQEYCKKTLGIPAENITYIQNSTAGIMKVRINQFLRTIKLNKDKKFLFFYFGHGFNSQDPAIQDAYLLPTDGKPTDVETCISRNDLLEKFSDYNPSQLVIFLESCFSGTTNEGVLMAFNQNSSGVRIPPKKYEFTGNIVLFTASSSDEPAYAYKDMQHNIFTFELLKILQETEANISLGELFIRVQQNTANTANKIRDASQTPSVQASTTIGDKWKKWRLK